MSEISGISNTHQPQQVEDVQAPVATNQTTKNSGPVFEVGTTQNLGLTPNGAPALRPEHANSNQQGWAEQMAHMSQSLDVVFALMSAMMLKETNDMSRAAKDLRVQQRTAAYEQDMAAAQSQRDNAAYGVIGSSVGAAGQAASAGMNVAGGVKGMQMTNTPVSASGTAASQTADLADTGADAAAGTAAEAVDAADTLSAATDAGADITPTTTPDADAASAAPIPDSADGAGANVAAEANAASTTKAPDDATKQLQQLAKMDSAESQRLSARAQNLSLTTSGVAGIMSSTGELGKAGFKYAADIKEAEAAEDRAEATKTRAMLDYTKEYTDKLQSYIEGMIRSQDEIQSNKNQTEKSIWSHV